MFAEANLCTLMPWEKAEEEERRVALSRMHASTIIPESKGDVKLWADASLVSAKSLSCSILNAHSRL